MLVDVAGDLGRYHVIIAAISGISARDHYLPIIVDLGAQTGCRLDAIDAV